MIKYKLFLKGALSLWNGITPAVYRHLSIISRLIS